MPKEKALDIIHGYIEDNAHRLHKTFVRIMTRAQGTTAPSFATASATATI